MQDRFKKIRNTLIIVLLLNWAVAIAKIIYGLISKSNAMYADGFHSFADGASNIIGLVGIMIASRPVDKDHPYGHKKYETFATIVISILLFIIAFNLIHDGIERLIRPVIPDVTIFSFIIMLCTMAVNFGVVIYERRRSKELKSDILSADAQHTKSDILVSVSVIFTLLAVRSGFFMVDSIVSIAIAFIIAYGALGILRESSDVLCDRTAIVADDIRNIVLGIEGVRDCHKIRTRGRADDIHIDLHILVNRTMHVERAHELANSIEKTIRQKKQNITDITVHIEPDTKDEKDMAH